jgi:hypothetical protein
VSDINPLPKLRWARESGQLAYALGVSADRSYLFDLTVGKVIDGGGGIRACLEAVEELPDLTLEELVATAFALGVFDGSTSRGR